MIREKLGCGAGDRDNGEEASDQDGDDEVFSPLHCQNIPGFLPSASRSMGSKRTYRSYDSD